MKSLIVLNLYCFPECVMDYFWWWWRRWWLGRWLRRGWLIVSWCVSSCSWSHLVDWWNCIICPALIDLYYWWLGHKSNL